MIYVLKLLDSGGVRSSCLGLKKDFDPDAQMRRRVRGARLSENIL